MSSDLSCASCGDDRVVRHNAEGARRFTICLGCGEVRWYRRSADGLHQLEEIGEVDSETRTRLREVTARSPMRPLFTRSRGN